LRKKHEVWLIPVFIVLAIFGVYIVLNYLPSSVFGTEWATIKAELWIYLPWLIIFGVGLFILARLTGRYW